MSLFRGYRHLNTATLPLNRGLRPHIVPVQMADSSGKPSKMPSDSRYRMPCITIMTISRAIVFLKGGGGERLKWRILGQVAFVFRRADADNVVRVYIFLG